MDKTIYIYLAILVVLYGIYRLLISDLGQTSDNETKRRQMEEYDRTWYCNKCATKFIC